MNVATYAVDEPGATTQDKIQSLRNWLNLITDIEVDARRKANEARKELEKLQEIEDSANDDEL
jgi:hypothetical protein